MDPADYLSEVGTIVTILKLAGLNLVPAKRASVILKKLPPNFYLNCYQKWAHFIDTSEMDEEKFEEFTDEVQAVYDYTPVETKNQAERSLFSGNGQAKEVNEIQENSAYYVGKTRKRPTCDICKEKN